MIERVLSSEMSSYEGRAICLAGWVHRIRDFGGVRFIVLRDRGGLAQIVLPRSLDISDIGCECVIRAEGKVHREPRAPTGWELHAENIKCLSCAEPPPVEIFAPPAAVKHRLETLLDNRAVSLRIPEVLDVFRIQAEILRAFREFLTGQGFTEVKTPKLVKAGAEGGSAIFEVGYFDDVAYLAQSPQFYKQIMVGSGLERVFEVGPVYRAEKSETSRHLTEYVSLDFEMGFVDSLQDVIEMHAALVRSIIQAVNKNCQPILQRRGEQLSEVGQIPQISFVEAKEILAKSFGKTGGLEGDLDTEGEVLIGQWAREQLDSEFIYVTGYSIAKRPAYTMADPSCPDRSRSFDLLYKGVEITTGGQRIHDYEQLVDSFKARRIDPAGCEGYLSVFRHGMCSHGGMGMGLERLTKQMLDLANVREACLFPRDRRRITP